MQLAIDKAKEGIAIGQSPFGAIIVKSDKIIAADHNTVWKTCDPTAHAEVNAIRVACRREKTIDLCQCVIYTTCEPCPMCLTAIHWAKIEHIYFGATIDDARAATFKELRFSAKELARRGKSHLVVHDGICRQSCIELFTLWKKKSLCASY